jgi:hypothetical protein
MLEDIHSMLPPKRSTYGMVTQNKANVGEGRRQPSQVIHRATMLVTEFTTTKKKMKTRLQRVQKWVRPPPDILKVNCNGSFFQETKRGG